MDMLILGVVIGVIVTLAVVTIAYVVDEKRNEDVEESKEL